MEILPDDTYFFVRPVGSEAEWQLAREIREQVFIVEQHCPPEEEWDAYDDVSRHFLGFLNGWAVATARWRTVSIDTRIVAKLERFAVLADVRGEGYGRALVAAVIEDARKAGFTTHMIHAQAHLERFYSGFDFVTAGHPFDEAGIPHVKMIRRDP
jgi:predicted GNAT family N-acyltransferase